MFCKCRVFVHEIPGDRGGEVTLGIDGIEKKKKHPNTSHGIARNDASCNG